MTEIQDSTIFSQAKARAVSYLRDPDKLLRLARSATVKATALRHNRALAKIWADLRVVFRLVGQSCAGNYTTIPVRSLILIIAALLYFVWPIDLVPDAIPIMGWLDDATLLAFVIRSIRVDLDAFQRWEEIWSDQEAVASGTPQMLAVLSHDE